MPTRGRPHAQELPVWVARFGSGEQSYIVLSAPQRSGYSGKAIVRTARFGAPGAIYAALDGTPVNSHVTQDATTVAIRLAERHPLILRKIGHLAAGQTALRAKLTPSQPGQPQVITCILRGKTSNKLRIITTAGGRQLNLNGDKVEWSITPQFVFLPSREDLATVSFGNDSARRFAIVVAEKDRAACAEEILHLAHYNVYYRTRLAYPDKRLVHLAPLWKDGLQTPVITPEEVSASPAQTFFVIGPVARKQLCPRVPTGPAVSSRRAGQKRYIALFPQGEISERYLLTALLAELDRPHPWSGAITERWAIRAKLYGKSFAK